LACTVLFLNYLLAYLIWYFNTSIISVIVTKFLSLFLLLSAEAVAVAVSVSVALAVVVVAVAVLVVVSAVVVVVVALAVAVAAIAIAAVVVVVVVVVVAATTKLSHFLYEGSTRRFPCQEFSDFPYAMERYLIRYRLATRMIYRRSECVYSVPSLNIY
jgi:hypothetical protein